MKKRVLSLALALMIMFACFAGVRVNADEAGYTAKLGFANSDWSVQEWGDNAQTTVTGPGTYSVSFNGAATNAFVFVVDIEGAGAAFAAAGIELTALTVTVDGVDIPVDVSKVATGDLENNGKFRIEIYNEYGSTKADPPVDPAAVNFAENLTVTFTLSGPNTYNATLGFANSDWSVQEWGTTAFTSVTGAGEYSVTFNGASTNALVFVVDIVGAYEEFAAKNLGLTGLSVLADGVEVPVDLSKVVTGDIEEKGNYRIEIFNEYGSTKENAPIDPAAVNFAESLTVNFTIGTVEAAPEGPVFDFFIAYGGDKVESNDWGYEYYGADTEKSAGITATKTQIGIGETATVSLTFDNPSGYSWFFAPCLTAEDVTTIGGLDFEITCKINGEEVEINMDADSQGRTWWTEGTGDYSGNQCIRLAGGYNEWGAQFVAQPESITTIEYTLTLKGYTEAVQPGTPHESTDEYFLFIAYGGDKEAENDWGYQYYGEDVDGITAVTAMVKSGDTATVSLTFDSANYNSWFFAPCLVGTGAGDLMYSIDMDIVCKIDGVEVPVDMEVNDGVYFWAEGTGSYVVEDCVRLAGGYNEWAPNVQYISKPESFTTIEYTITFNSIMICEPEEEIVVEIDKDGTYNAYLMLQTPNWTFRNAHDDAFYGMEGSSWADLGLTWGQYLVHQDHPGETWGAITDAVIAGNGTYSVKITDFGTIFADDFAAAGQDYFNIIAISTDLPAGADVTITDVKLIIDGQVRHTYDEAYINEESTGTLQILIQNIWNADVKEISYYAAPTESLEIQFTIAGFNYDNEGQGGENQGGENQGGENQGGETTNPTNPTNPSQGDTTEQPTTEKEAKSGAILYIVIAAVAVVGVVVVLFIAKGKKK